MHREVQGALTCSIILSPLQSQFFLEGLDAQPQMLVVVSVYLLIPCKVAMCLAFSVRWTAVMDVSHDDYFTASFQMVNLIIWILE